MHRRHLLAGATVVAWAGRAGLVHVLAHDEHMVKRTVLAEAAITALPDANGDPFELWLVRWQFPPNATFQRFSVPGFHLVTVTSGDLNVEADGAVNLIDQGTPTAIDASPVTMRSGQSLFIEGSVPVSFGNASGQPADVIMFYAFPKAAESELTGEIGDDPNARPLFLGGWVATILDLPAEAALVRLERVTIPKGMAAPHVVAGAAIVAVEEGNAQVTLETGAGMAVPFGIPLPNGTDEYTLVPGTPVEVMTGGYYAVGPGSTLQVASAGEQAATLLRAIIEPDSGNSTPAT